MDNEGSDIIMKMCHNYENVFREAGIHAFPNGISRKMVEVKVET